MPEFSFKYVVGDKVIVVNGQVKGEITHRRLTYVDNVDVTLYTYEYCVKLAPNKSLWYQERQIELDVKLDELAEKIINKSLKSVPDQYKKVKTDELLKDRDYDGLRDLHK
jgi:hypothetical protein